MAREQVDILVAGGGIAGRIATLVMADAGFSTLCVDPGPQSAPDQRSTAFLNPSIALLSGIGLFDRLRPHAARLSVMRLCDAGGIENQIRETVDFPASEIGADEFGWNIPNAPLRDALAAAIEAANLARARFGVGVERATPRLKSSLVRLSDGTMVDARLVIAADGRDSPLRAAAGIAAPRVAYDQTALAFQVRHDRPHDGVSIELHRSGGPFTLVPLTDPHRSAIVWMETNKAAARLRALDDDAFLVAAQARSCDVLGLLSDPGPRGAWPVVSQRASTLSAPRLALIAEAAHVVPPIGAQGLNMSLADIAALREQLRRQDDPGAPAALAAYARRRAPDIALRLAGIDLLNRAARTDLQSLRDLRRIGLRALAGSGGLKTAAMRGGLGTARPSSF